MRSDVGSPSSYYKKVKHVVNTQDICVWWQMTKHTSMTCLLVVLRLLFLPDTAAASVRHNMKFLLLFMFCLSLNNLFLCIEIWICSKEVKGSDYSHLIAIAFSHLTVISIERPCLAYLPMKCKAAEPL